MNKAKSRGAAILKELLNKSSNNNNNNNNMKMVEACFHSTPVLDRKRRNHWNNISNVGGGKATNKKYNRYGKSRRQLYEKEELLRNVGAFAEQLFQNFRNGYDEKDMKDKWFRREFDGESSKGGRKSTKGKHFAGKRGFDFCDNVDDSDVENMFEGMFGGPRFFYCSFVDGEFPGTDWSSRYDSSRKWKRKHFSDDEEGYDTSSKSHSFDPDREVLGLCTSGPLTIEDVKNAYRLCALKWHPDRHQGETRAIAEEKFKACNAAYESICDKLFPA